jgi:hypothetical protein
MAGIVLYVALLLALFDWLLQPLIFFLQGLFTLKLLLWLPLLLVIWLLASRPQACGPGS